MKILRGLTLLILSLLLLLVYANNADAQVVYSDGRLDPDFVNGEYKRLNSSPNVIAIQDDEKTLIGGLFTSYDGATANNIVRLNTDDSLDASFSSGTGISGGYTIYDIQIQDDGKILIGGSFTAYNGTTANNIARLNTDGSLDTSFNMGTGFNSYVNNLQIQDDGKILAGGYFTSYNGTAVNYIARLNTDGSLDTSFNIGTGFNSEVVNIKIQLDGKIIADGVFTSYNGTALNRIARLNTDGSLDASFNIGTGFDYHVNSLAIQPDGKILAGGRFTAYNGTALNHLARLNSDGSLDASFNIGTGFSEYIDAIQVQDDGKILVGGYFNSYNGTAVNYLARLNTDGSLDTSFNMGTGANGVVMSIRIQDDGKILIGGAFTTYNGTTVNYISRLNSDGSLHSTLGQDSSGFSNVIYSTAIQDDGKVLAGGYFTSYNGTAVNYIARLNTDGSLDTGFDMGTGFNDIVYSVQIQDDGKILVGGRFTAYNGTTLNRIARLNTDGSLDASFNIGTGFNNNYEYVRNIQIQNDGKILAGGRFISYNGTALNRIARLNSDGSLDASFNIGTGFNNIVYSIQIQDDGKILIGGNFTSYNGTALNRIARLNSDGSLDASFNIGTGFNNIVYSIQIQDDGKILIGGYFTIYNGTAANRITRLNADGTLDTTFNEGGAGANNYVFVISVQGDGKILIGGYFTTYNGTAANRITRLNADGTLDTTFNEGGAGANSSVFDIKI